MSRYEICVVFPEGCGGETSYRILTDNVISVSEECFGKNCFLIDGDISRNITLEWECGDYTETTTYTACSSDSDCPNCNGCIDGVCTSTCDKQCYNDECVDCLDGSHCPAGYVCAGFNCVLAPGFKPCQNGTVSRECEEDCNDCQDYIDGVCVAKTCPDPDDCGGRAKSHCFEGECVECLIASDCGVNEVCNDNTCECSAGFTRDLITGECVDDYTCFNSADCADCHSCIQGKCVPEFIPSGFICLGGDIVQTCVNGSECPSGICSGGVCVTGNPNCPNTPCVNYTDCDEGCGCDGVCVDCEQYDCIVDNDCPLGCNCQDLKCRAFVGPDADDCSLLNCFDNTCSDSPDCECNDGLECVPKECTDSLSIEKLSCGLRVQYTGDSACACPVIGLGSATTITGAGAFRNIRVDLELRRGVFTNYANFLINPLLSQSISQNEVPISGTVNVSVEVRYRKSDINGVPVGTTTLTQTFAQSNLTFIGQDSNSITFNNVPDIGSVVTISQTYYVVTNVRVIRQNAANFNFPNGCVYTSQESVLQAFNSSRRMNDVQVSGNYGNSALYLQDNGNQRLPLLTLYRGSNLNQPMLPVTALYGTTFDVFHPFVQQYQFYMADSDCGCADPVVYECGGEQRRLVICDPSDMVFEVLDCGTKVRFLQDVRATCDIVIAGATRYRLFADDTVIVPERIIDPSGVIFSQNEIIDVGFIFNKLRLKTLGDVCEECDVEVNVPIPVLDFTVSAPNNVSLVCGNDGTAPWTIGFLFGAANYDYSITLNGNTVAGGSTGGSSVTVDIPIQAGIYGITVGDANGCIRFKTLSWTPVVFDNGFTNSFSYECLSTSQARLTVTSGFPGTLSAAIVSDNGYNSGFTMTGSYSVVVPVIDGEEFTLTLVSPLPECPNYTDSVVVSCCPAVPFPTIPTPIYTCADGLLLSLLGGLTYEISGNPVESGDRLAAGSYTVIATDGVCEQSYNLTVPTCYACFGDLCLADIDGVYSDNTCDNECDPVIPCPGNDYEMTFTIGGGGGCDLEEVVVSGTTAGVTYGNLFVLEDLPSTDENWADFGVDLGAGTLGVWAQTCGSASYYHFRVLLSQPGCPDEWLYGFFSCDACGGCEPCITQTTNDVPSSRMLKVTTNLGDITFYDVSYWVSCIFGSGDNPAIVSRIQDFLDLNDECDTPVAQIDNGSPCVIFSVANSSITFLEVHTTTGVYPYQQFCEGLP